MDRILIFVLLLQLPFPYDREYLVRHETVGEFEQFADAIDDTFLKNRAPLLSEEDVFRDARNALIIVYGELYQSCLV